MESESRDNDTPVDEQMNVVVKTTMLDPVELRCGVSLYQRPDA